MAKSHRKKMNGNTIRHNHDFLKYDLQR